MRPGRDRAGDYGGSYLTDGAYPRSTVAAPRKEHGDSASSLPGGRLASAEVVSRAPGSARTQVKGRLHLDNSIEANQGPSRTDRSRSASFAQVNRLKFREPSTG